MLFPFLCDINEKDQVFLHSKSSPQSDMKLLSGHPSLIIFPLGDTKLEQLLPTKCLGGLLPLHVWPFSIREHHAEVEVFVPFSLLFSGAEPLEYLSKRSKVPASSQFQLLRSERQPLGVHYTFRLNTPALTLYCTRILNSFWLRYKACFLPGCPGLSFFPLSLVGVQE